MSVLVTAPAASAAEPVGSVTVPQGSEILTTYRSLRASGDRLLLVQQSQNHPTRVFVGTSSSLVPQPKVPDGAVTATRGVLSGTTLGWSDTLAGHLRVTRLDTTTQTTTTADFGADDRIAYPEAAGTLVGGVTGATRYLDLWTAGGTTRVLSGFAGLISVSADEAGYLVVLNDAGFTSQSLVQIDLPEGVVRTLATIPHVSGQLPEFDAVAQTAGTVAWVDHAGGGAVLHRRGRHATAQTDQSIPARPAQLAVTDTSSAWVQGNGVAILGATATTPAVAPLPPVTSSSSAVAGLAATAAGFVVVRGGYGADAGLWTVTSDGVVTRGPTPPAEPERYLYVGLTGGRLRYTSIRSESQPWLLRGRGVTGTSALALGAEVIDGNANGGEFDVSDARVAVMGATSDVPPGGSVVWVTDRGFLTAEIPSNDALPSFQVSGPYVLVGSSVHSADDGRRIGSVPSTESNLVLDGSRLASLDPVDGTVRVRDLTRLAAAPLIVPVEPACAGAPRLSGRHLLLVDSTSTCIVDLVTRAVRSVPVVVSDVADGTATWSVPVATGFATRYDVGTLDLTSATSVPVTLGRSFDGRTWADSHRVAWTDSAGALHVSPVTTVVGERPRLLGVLTPSALSLSGPGDVWRPAVDLSERMTSVVMTIRRGSTVVRTLSGTAPDGSVRNVTWDGRNASGALVPDGVYTWTLSGTAADGSGSPTGADGTGAATGSVTVDRTGRATAVSLPATTATGTAGAGVPVSWTPAVDLAGNPAVSYDVRYRRVTVSAGGAVSYSTPVSWRRGTTGRSATLTGTDVVPGTVWQFSARSHDLAGNTGPWSAWKGTSVSYDDTALTASGAWTHPATTGAYRTTESVSSSAGASLTETAWGSRLTLVGSRCPGCGAVKVYVDGTLAATVDTRAATTQTRVLLWSRTYARARHAVRLVVVGTAGRPQVRVDALGFQLP